MYQLQAFLQKQMQTEVLITASITRFVSLKRSLTNEVNAYIGLLENKMHFYMNAHTHTHATNK